MKHLLKQVAAVVCLLMVSSFAFGSSIANHTTVTPTLKGDLLLFPFFYTDQWGSETKITVINTAQDQSVVAKVVLRGWKTSPELLDFLLYLSPTDMWTGYLRYDATTKKTKIHSEDGSVLNQANAFASATAPMDYPLYDGCTVAENEMGYVTVTAVWRSANLANLAKPPITNKGLIKTAYETDQNAPNITRLVGNATANYGGTGDVLAGYLELGTVVAGATATRAMVEATTLQGYGNVFFLKGNVESRIGWPGDANNNLFEIEAALAKAQICIPYKRSADLTSQTFFTFTFPTKQASCDNKTFRGPFFATKVPALANVIYKATAYDTEENWKDAPTSPYSGGTQAPADTFPYELNVINSNTYPFTEGWAYFDFSDYGAGRETVSMNLNGQTLRYTGVPVIATGVIKVNNKLSMIPAAYTDGVVQADLSAPLNGLYFDVIDYQITDERRLPPYAGD